MFVRTAASSGGNAELDAMLARISQLEGVIDGGGNGGGEDGGDGGVGSRSIGPVGGARGLDRLFQGIGVSFGRGVSAYLSSRLQRMPPHRTGTQSPGSQSR